MTITTIPLDLDADTEYAWSTWRGMPGYSKDHDDEPWNATPRDAAEYVRDECRRMLNEAADADDDPGVATGYATNHDLNDARQADLSDLEHAAATSPLEDVLTTGTYQFLMVSGNRGYGSIVGVTIVTPDA